MNHEIDFDTFCINHGIIISMHDNLSTRVRGFCYYDGLYYNVVLNCRYDSLQLKTTTIHEIVHILRNHFSCSMHDAWECEREVKSLISIIELVFV